jgi:hypothetical protein
VYKLLTAAWVILLRRIVIIEFVVDDDGLGRGWRRRHRLRWTLTAATISRPGAMDYGSSLLRNQEAWASVVVTLWPCWSLNIAYGLRGRATVVTHSDIHVIVVVVVVSAHGGGLG